MAGFDTARIDVGEVTLHVRTAGSGPPLVLLHGCPETYLGWAPVAEALAADVLSLMRKLGYALPERDTAGTPAALRRFHGA